MNFNVEFLPTKFTREIDDFSVNHQCWGKSMALGRETGANQMEIRPWGHGFNENNR
jgi:hypothetical protein